MVSFRLSLQINSYRLIIIPGGGKQCWPEGQKGLLGNISHHREQNYWQKDFKIMKKSVRFLTEHSPRKTNQLRMSLVRTENLSEYFGVTETVVWNICLFQVPAMVGTSAYTNLNHKFYKSMVQAISGCGGYCAAKVRALCTHFF